MYTITNELKYTKVMSYEMVTIIKELYNAGEIFLYKYMFRDAERVSMAPSGVRQEMISKGIIQETDIIDSYDFDTIIDNLYRKALPQN